MPYYVKVTKKVREAILPAYLVVQKTFDGNSLQYHVRERKSFPDFFIPQKGHRDL